MLKTKAQNLLKDQRGGVGFEYTLIIGGVSAVILIAVGVAAPSLFGTVMDAACTPMKNTFEMARHPEKGVHNHQYKLSCPKTP